MLQVETASEASSPRSEASDDHWVSSRQTSGHLRTPSQSKEAGAKAAPSWLTEWRLKLALSSKV